MYDMYPESWAGNGDRPRQVTERPRRRLRRVDTDQQELVRIRRELHPVER